MDSTTQQAQGRPGTGRRGRIVAAVRRALGLERRGVRAMSSDARLDLALAIARQYVLVSQSYPVGEEEDGQTLASSPVCGSGGGGGAAEGKQAAPSLLSRFIHRPRTGSAGSNGTICDPAPDTPATLVASRENPICC
ncbi:hypothetical protein H4R18_004461 [Coemansia javaensis]|uniref:Uncharacterized protein n=1 Tax=Coemansia javaensis TaxID=2761396 RepID=A0A9W8HAQ4_9FUNG|nr:hypothetical protein H4R18_004461 [Coemansia javaensis]